jgi:hypothetical protein
LGVFGTVEILVAGMIIVVRENNGISFRPSKSLVQLERSVNKD